ncbi:uncharacterized protein G2W53_032704 [Senna tora]|uniref:Uncharacterized protein n=1 Tax=Senna tora TaxID=362788 RepID=A0A834W7W0_9FABA|nr:uncharacterized protein G2W53_032704 [Senna tora]
MAFSGGSRGSPVLGDQVSWLSGPRRLWRLNNVISQQRLCGLITWS